MQAYYLTFPNKADYERDALASGLIKQYADAITGQSFYGAAEGIVVDEVGLDGDGNYLVNVLAKNLPQGLPEIAKPQQPKRVFAGF